jgi:hypothetical protein
MARLKDVVDECLTVADAYVDISSSTYNELSAVNWEDNDKDFPMFLFDKRSVNVTVDKYSRTNLPSSSIYTATVYFFNTYKESEKASTDLQTKQDTLIDYASKYFAELRSRNESGSNGFYLGAISFNSLDEAHSGNLIQLAYNVEFIVKVENCTLGDFNY